MARFEYLLAIGVLLVIVGFFIIFLGMMLMGAKETASKTKVAVGGFIGFIPFGFGNDKNLLWLVTILSLVLFLFWMFFSFRIWK